jgi:probable addiction module antidote protein
VTQKTRSYSAWRTEQLSDPERAARYLDAAFKESKEAFFHALTNVIQAHQVSAIAKKAGVTRESLYRSFSATGHPKHETLESVLSALDLQFSGIETRSVKTAMAGPSSTSKPTGVTGIRKRRGRQRRTSNTSYLQLSLPLSDVGPIVSAGVQAAAIEQHSYVGFRASDVISEVTLLPGFMLQQQQGGATAQSFLP